MSTQQINLTAELRTVTGKQVRSLRADGVIPAVVYERGKESVSISIPSSEAQKVFLRAGKHNPINLSIGSDKRLAMIKDVDLEPVKGRMRHIAFHAVKQDEKVTAEVPLVLDGEVPAERVSLMVLRTLDRIEVEALPSKLPNEIKVDASKLVEVGDQVTLEDLKLPKDVEFPMNTDLTQPIYIVEEPRSAAAEAAAEAEAAEQAGGDTGVPAEVEATNEE